MRRAWLLLLIGVLVSLPVGAHASPPDPTWIGGFYDDGDHDDAVIAVTGMHGALDEGPSWILAPLRRVSWTVAGSVPTPDHAPHPDPHPTRAPPAA